MDKVKRVMNAEVPRNNTQVRSLLGLVGYYRKIVNNFASRTAPLSDLTNNGMPDTVKWSDDLQNRFEEIKSKNVKYALQFSVHERYVFVTCTRNKV